MARDGPTISSHQPGAGSAIDELACADGDSPVNMTIALSRAADSSPHVS
jgi:hypothetical protein